MSIRSQNLAFIDLETTGLDPEKHEIIEIGCIIAEQNQADDGRMTLKVLDEFALKVKPEHLQTADVDSLQINGYNEADWLFALSLPQAMKVVAEKTAGTIMVAQNIAFDWLFLEKAFVQTNIVNKMDFHRLDLLSMAFAKLCHQKEPQRFSLRALAEYFDLKNEKAHTALADIRVTVEIYQKLLEM